MIKVLIFRPERQESRAGAASWRRLSRKNAEKELRERHKELDKQRPLALFYLVFFSFQKRAEVFSSLLIPCLQKESGLLKKRGLADTERRSPHLETA
jgi:hypothetical protein